MGIEFRRLLLVRHAQGSLGSSNYDQLSELGYRQAGHLAAHLERELQTASIVHGSLQRHRQTAARIRTLAVDRVDPDLDEYRVDHLLQAALARAGELGMKPPDPAAFSDPRRHLDVFLDLFPRVLCAWQETELECRNNGPWRDFRARVDAAGRRLAADLQRFETVVAVTSAGVISTLAAGLLERDLGWQRRLNVTLYNASITELRHSDANGWTAVVINDVAHLAADDLQTLA